MQLAIWGWSTTDNKWLKALVDSSGHLQVDVLSGIGVASQCYGYDGAAWQTLLTEDATNFNLRVALYSGANLLGTTLTGSQGMSGATYGLNVKAQICGLSGLPLVQRPTNADGIAGFAGNYALLTVATLWGFNGSTFDRLRCGTPADALATSGYALDVRCFLMGYNGTTWDMLRSDTNKYLIVNSQFGGNVYSKTMTMTDDNPTRFETTAKKLRDIVIIVKTHPMLLGETGVEVYPVGADETVGFTKVDISTLYFKNAGAGNNGVISILGVEE